MSAVYTQGRVSAPRGLWLGLGDPTCTSHLQRESQAANRAGGSLGLGPGRVSARAWIHPTIPAREQDSGGDRLGSPASHRTFGAGTSGPGLGWNGALGPCGMCGMKSLHLGMQIPHLKDFPDPEGRW